MSWPPRFIFIASRLCLDFAQTGGEGERARWERWHSPSDLADWLQECPSLGIRANVSEDDLRKAQALREAILSAAKAVIRGEDISPESLILLNRAASHPSLVPRLERDSMLWAPNASGQQILSTVARDAIDLFGSGTKSRLRKCRNPTCDLMFVDLSRPGKRAWCSMERCGNLNKIARYRADQDSASQRAAPAVPKGG